MILKLEYDIFHLIDWINFSIEYEIISYIFKKIILICFSYDMDI